MNLKVITEEFLYTNLSSLIIASVLVIWFGDGMRLLKEVYLVASVACAVLVIRGYVQNANVALHSTETFAMITSYFNALVNGVVDFVASIFVALSSSGTIAMTMNYLNALVNDSVKFLATNLQDISIPKFEVLNDTVVVFLTVFATSAIFSVFDRYGITTPTGKRLIAFVSVCFLVCFLE
jgi:hypothetical protein